MAARPRQALGKSGRNRIACRECEHRKRRPLLGRQHWKIAQADDEFDLACHEFRNEPRQSIGVPSRAAAFDCEILARDVAAQGEAAEKWRFKGATVGPGDVEQSDAINFGRGLR